LHRCIKYFFKISHWETFCLVLQVIGLSDSPCEFLAMKKCVDSPINRPDTHLRPRTTSNTHTFTQSLTHTFIFAHTQKNWRESKLQSFFHCLTHSNKIHWDKDFLSLFYSLSLSLSLSYSISLSHTHTHTPSHTHTHTHGWSHCLIRQWVTNVGLVVNTSSSSSYSSNHISLYLLKPEKTSEESKRRYLQNFNCKSNSHLQNYFLVYTGILWTNWRFFKSSETHWSTITNFNTYLSII
jgi:hypothetical protein